MKLNPDCVRDILIWLEDNIKVNNDNSFEIKHLIDLNNGLPQYSEDEIYYTIYNLFQVRFIEGKFSLLPSGSPKICEINNITWNGHQFLNNVRPKVYGMLQKQEHQNLELCLYLRLILWLWKSPRLS